MALIDEFKKSLETPSIDQRQMDTAIDLLLVCRGYIETHYKNSVYGKYQKTLLEVIDEFLNEVKNGKT